MFIWLSVFLSWWASVRFPAPCMSPPALWPWLQKSLCSHQITCVVISCSIQQTIICFRYELFSILLLLYYMSASAADIFSFVGSLLFFSGCSLFLEHWQIFSVSCMCAMKPTNQILTDLYLFQFLVFVDDIIDSANCWNCVLLQRNSCFVDNILVDGKSSFHISLSMTDTQGYFHHNNQTVVLWITQIILLCGYPWPVLINWCNMAVWSFYPFQWYISICLIQSTFGGHWIEKIHLACHVRHRCSQLFHHLNAVWISSHGRLQTLNAKQERVPQRQCVLEIFAVTFQELYHILVKQCQSRILICLQFLEKKLTFNCFSWHLCGRDTTPWDHWSCLSHWKWLSIIVLTTLDVYSCFALNCQNIGFIGHLVKYRTI